MVAGLTVMRNTPSRPIPMTRNMTNCEAKVAGICTAVAKKMPDMAAIWGAAQRRRCEGARPSKKTVARNAPVL